MQRYPGVRRLPDGRYLLRVKARDPKTGKMIDIRAKVRAASPADAFAQREELRREAEQSAGEVTRERLRACASSWLASKLPAVRASTRRHYAETLDLHILPALGEYFVDAINADDVVAWRDAQAKQTVGEGEKQHPISAVTVNTRLRVLRRLLADVTHERGLRNPAERVPGVRVPKRRKPKGLEPGQLRAALDELRKTAPHWYRIAFVKAVTGQRWGAISALSWAHVDFDAGVIRFEKAHVRGVVDDQKTGADVEVPMVPELREVLEEQRDELRRAEKRRRERRDPGTLVLEVRGLEGPWVFPSKRQTLMQPSSLRKPLAAACVAAKVPVISPHGLRYSFNHAAKRIASADVARSITGHVTEEMTRHYDWVPEGEKRAAVASVVRLVGGTSGGTRTDGTESAG